MCGLFLLDAINVFGLFISKLVFADWYQWKGVLSQIK